MAAELYALIYGFDNAYFAEEVIHEILSLQIPIDGYVDSKILLNIAKARKYLRKTVTN